MTSVDLPTLTSMLCSRHFAKVILELQPLVVREQMLRLGLAEAGMYHPDVLSAAGLDRANEQKASFKRLNSALREFSPLCCLIGDAEFKKLIRAVRGGPVNFQMWRIAMATPEILAGDG